MAVYFCPPHHSSLVVLNMSARILYSLLGCDVVVLGGLDTNDQEGTMSKEKKSVRARIPLLPLRDVIIFPHMVVPLFVGREKSINALEECVTRKLDLFLVAQRQATTVSPGEKDIFSVGTVGTILQILDFPTIR